MSHCHRCGQSTYSTIMSMYSHEMICADCKEQERNRPDYSLAEAKDLEEYALRLEAYHPEQAAGVRSLAAQLRQQHARRR